MLPRYLADLTPVQTLALTMVHKIIHHLTSHLPHLSDLISKYSPQLGSLNSSTLVSLLILNTPGPPPPQKLHCSSFQQNHNFSRYPCGWLPPSPSGLRSNVTLSAKHSVTILLKFNPLPSIFPTLFLFLVSIAILYIVYIYFFGSLPFLLDIRPRETMVISISFLQLCFRFLNSA